MKIVVEICEQCGRPYESLQEVEKEVKTNGHVRPAKTNWQTKMCAKCWKALVLSDRADDREPPEVD